MTITIDTDECEASGVCAVVCPEGVIELNDGRPVIVNNLACTSCWKCAESCVSGAIDID
jgi:NAD-dependent dihydropyrimidine dehydrogenase PreA subunit